MSGGCDAGQGRRPRRFADHDGTRVFFEVFGAGEPTMVPVPSNPIVPSRQWKAQVPYLSRHYRVVTFDGRGNGRSDRPVAPEAYTEEAYVAELEAVLDATGSDRVVLVGLCHDGVWRSLRFAADHPERVAGIVAISVGVPAAGPARRLGELTGAPLVVLEGAGHLPTARHPVKVNLLIREFVDRLAPAAQ